MATETILLASKIQAMPTNEVNVLITEIARKTKKKRLQSGNMFYSEFCKHIAESLQKQSTRELIVKFNLQ